jgi:hypothetical protein
MNATWPELRVFERLLQDHYAGSSAIDYQRARRELERDGNRIDQDDRITNVGISFRPGALANLTDATAIHDGLDRIRRAEQDHDPALVIGAAKELIESTAKLTLTELGLPVDPAAGSTTGLTERTGVGELKASAV